ncbi:MAG: hypothetical protein HYU64_20485 [Armatimonadetes bacterium]|nr:hypothetical protein [Armatimonadota bacterium]
MTIISPFPTLSTSHLPLNGGSLKQKTDKPGKQEPREILKTAADVGIGAGMIGLTGLTVLNSGAALEVPKTGAPAIAFANMGAGIFYVVDQLMQVASVPTNSGRYHDAPEDLGKFAGGLLGLGAGISLAASGFSQAVGWPGGFVVALSTISAALMASKAIAQMKL